MWTFTRTGRRSLPLALALLMALVQPAARPPGPGPASLHPAAVALAQDEEPGVYRATLPNGIVLVTKERPDAEVAALSIYVRGGSRNEDPSTVGAAHFMEHMFFQGTPTRPNSAAIDDPITERGGWLNATTAWEGITFFGTVPNSAFDVLLDTLSDILVNSVFAPDALEKERRVVIEELNRSLNNPNAYAFETYAKTVFADHPAHQMPGGDRSTVRTVSRDTLLAFRDRFFRASNLVVAAVGNLHHEEVEAQVAAAFANMRDGPAPTFTPSPRPAAKLRVERLSVGARQAQIILGWPTVGTDSPDRYALQVLASALGSSGQVLAADLRDRLGLVTRVDTGYWELTDVGTWLIAAAAEPDKVDDAVAGMLDQVRAVRDTPLDPDELANAKAYIRGSDRRGLERSIDQAQDLSTGIALGNYQPLDEYLGHIAAVTADDVQRVARTYLDPDNYTLVVLGP
ncbi:MAG TPA: pitrilysin family protein [Chloroflexota bacterium]|nr:pitrilysin family protein [Chloroflexota bacterium]